MNQLRGLGRAVVATGLRVIAGVMNIISGLAAIWNTKFLAHDTRYLFASPRSWGRITLILGILGLGALRVIPGYPVWSLAALGPSLWNMHCLTMPSGHGDAPGRTIAPRPQCPMQAVVR
jgi:hypothetical protein